MTDSIGVRGLHVEAIIGVREDERRRRQPLEFDIECVVDTSKAARSDNLDDTVSYSDVARTVEDVARRRPHGLLEGLAEECCQVLFVSFVSIRAVEIEIRKPLAMGGVAVPYVRIARRRDSHTGG